MWIFMFIYMLSLNFSQAAETVSENSTQIYYATLVVDQSVSDKIDEMLHFTVSNKSLIIEDVKRTTECVVQNKDKTCQCESGHRWSDEVCQETSCCGQGQCSLQKNSVQTCILNTTVGVAGKLILKGQEYGDCLKDQSSTHYKKCHDDLTEKMKEEYSKINGFDTLGIVKFSVGSVVVDFAMKIVSAVNSQALVQKSVALAKSLTASLELETTGVVNLELPRDSVLFDHSTSMKCTTTEDFVAEPTWNLKRADGTFLITNGSVATVFRNPIESKVSLNHVNELWEGEYICFFVQKDNNITIKHKANAKMDVCLLPKIEASAEPTFPLCIEQSDIKIVKVKCEIKQTAENYTVSWEDGVSRGPVKTEGDKIIYTAEKVVSCSEKKDAVISCNFTNNCNQTQHEKAKVEVIYVGDQFCSAEGDWANTKAGFYAEIKCSNQAGKRRRFCSQTSSKDQAGKWREEISECIEPKLNDVMEDAKISDIGLGELEKNAAMIFERFEGVTKTSKLSGYANVDTSVTILSIMEEKLKGVYMRNQSAIENFLFSSSHLLNKSLESTWNATPPENSSSSIAERYLLSVEKLIERAEIIGKTRRENLEVDVCNDTKCDVSVFDTEVSLENAGKAKTTGFRFLESYLPYDENKSVPNSIVVSATAENKSDVKITIDFKLLILRPRNVMLECVFWNTTLKQWSKDGCEWKGALKEGRCVCKHLSTFAILMSKEPLEVPGLTYVTIGALSVSAVSLVITLVIELIVWSEVVKTSTLYLRHTAHVNISLCLLVADLCFLASAFPKDISELWCRTSVVLKHFCYLAMFFWMFCLSATLLHQAVFLFHKVSRRNYFRFSLVVGYVCPLLIVFITFLTNDGGAEGKYYLKETCWLIYGGLLKGTIYTFIIPVGAIVFINVFSMLVVIMKLISHHTEIHKKTEISPEKEKAAAKTVVRSVILLTPIFGVTWIFGFVMLMLDLTTGPVAYAVNYIFTLINGFQGLFILLTTCLGDRMTREALQKFFKKKAPTSSVSESTTKEQPRLKK